MGYMDKDAITVDAILTKKGRQMLSDGGSLDIDSFTLSDTGVDYTLWNPDHPSGSAFYGEAIENLPMLEASVHSQYAMRNKLITLSRDTVAMQTQVIYLIHSHHTLLLQLSLDINLVQLEWQLIKQCMGVNY